MTQIDWSKAPTAYPLWLEGIGEHAFRSGWYRDCGEVFKGADGGQFRSVRKGKTFIVHSKPSSVTWSGNGLPPVGLKVEAALLNIGGSVPADGDFYRITIKYKSTDFCVLEREDGKEFPLWNPQPSQFRPIRSTEQIEEDAEYAFFDQMGQDLGEATEHESLRKLAHYLWKAGYRKQADQ